MPARIELFDERLAPVVRGARTLERLCTGAAWSEGPVWIEEDDSVLWSDIPGNCMLRWSARDGMRVFRENVEFTNERRCIGSVLRLRASSGPD